MDDLNDILKINGDVTEDRDALRLRIDGLVVENVKMVKLCVDADLLINVLKLTITEKNDDIAILEKNLSNAVIVLTKEPVVDTDSMKELKKRNSVQGATIEKLMREISELKSLKV